RRVRFHRPGDRPGPARRAALRRPARPYGGDLGDRRDGRRRQDRARGALGTSRPGQVPRRAALRQPPRVRAEPGAAADRRAQRVAAEPAAAAELARLCAHLPLALRIAAANLPDGERIADYAARLGAGDRLAVLAVEGDEQAAVRATFDLSYASLPEPTRRMFR